MKYFDNNGLAYLIQKIKLWDNGKVDKETGKSLISDTEIARLANVTNYDDTAIQTAINGKTTLAAVQALGYQTASDVSTAINSAIAGITGISFSIVQALPQSGAAGTIYLIAKTTAGTNDAYDEYIWVNNGFEYLGTTAVDLSGYVQTTDLVAITNGEIDTIIAGE